MGLLTGRVPALADYDLKIVIPIPEQIIARDKQVAKSSWPLESWLPQVTKVPKAEKIAATIKIVPQRRFQFSAAFFLCLSI